MLVLKNVSANYDGAIIALQEIDMTIASAASSRFSAHGAARRRC